MTNSPKTVYLYQGFHVLQGGGHELGSAHQKKVKEWATFGIQI